MLPADVPFVTTLNSLAERTTDLGHTVLPHAIVHEHPWIKRGKRKLTETILVYTIKLVSFVSIT